jgi:hypothetical protein
MLSAAPRVGIVTLSTGPTAITHSRHPNSRMVAQEAMLSCAAVNQMKLSMEILAGQRYPLETSNAVLNKEIGEIMEYR